MSIFSKLVIAFTLLSTAPVYAGGFGAHGGESVLCKNQSPLFYDAFEAKALRGFDVNLGPANLTLEEKVKFALDRYAPRDPERSAQYQLWANTFLSEADIGDFDVVPIDDAKHVVLPEGCEVKQLINQRAPQIPTDKRYLISKTIWDQMTTDQQAVAILHEIIYRDAISLGLVDSTGSRLLNSYIFSEAVAQLTDKDYWNLLKTSQFIAQKAFSEDYRPTVRFNGILVYGVETLYDDAVLSPQFYRDGRIAHADKTQPPRVIQFVGGTLETIGEDGGEVNFSETGAMQSISPGAGFLHLKNQVTETASGLVEFDEQGHLVRLFMDRYGGSLKIQAQDVYFEGQAYFFPSGAIKVGFITEKVTLQRVDGKFIKIKARSEVEFDERGLVVSVHH